MKIRRFFIRLLGMRIFDAIPIIRQIKLFILKKILKLENDVSFHSHVMIGEHHLPPNAFQKINKLGLKVGKNCVFDDYVKIDTTGNVIIGDDVWFGEDVLVYTHSHKNHTNPELPKYEIEASTIRIEDNVFIGARSIILSSCHHIGKNVRIGAGSVVTKDVPANVIVAGVPAKVIREFV